MHVWSPCSKCNPTCCAEGLGMSCFYPPQKPTEAFPNINSTFLFQSGANKEKFKSPCYQIKEGDQVNTDVTSPGATIALGLMFFQTANR